METINKISVVGAGNVASHIVPALKNAGYGISYIYAKNTINTRKLAAEVGAIYSTDIEEVVKDCDLLIISVNDDEIANIAQQLAGSKVPVVHTAGSVSVDVLSKVSDKTGVLYPLQTFNIHRKLEFNTVPICVESECDEFHKELLAIAGKISDKVVAISQEQRLCLHIAAIFACNFTNHMYVLSKKILQTEGLDFELLKPLISETAQRIISASPEEVQTGPAIRGDFKILKKHQEWLEKNKDLLEIYKLLSYNIQNNNEI